MPLQPAAATADILGRLRNSIRAIERSSAAVPGPAPAPEPAQRWTLGAIEVDDALGPAGLEIGAVHEIKPAAGGDWQATTAAALSFALMLASRRLACCARERAGAHVLWCASAAATAEHGRLYGPGLRALGLEPSRLLIVEPARQQDALWALEEGLKSDALALAVALVDEVELTPARRLALAAAHAATPCLLLTHPRSEAAAATATRWRAGPAPSGTHPYDFQAPGPPHLVLSLERCRGRPAAADNLSVMLEWCDGAYRFRVAPAVADRTNAAGEPGVVAGFGAGIGHQAARP